MNKPAHQRRLGPRQTRFGLHLIQVLERRTVDIEMKQLRDQARNARCASSSRPYKDWVAELRAKAFAKSGNGWTEAGPKQRLRAVRRLPKARRPASRRAGGPAHHAHPHPRKRFGQHFLTDARIDSIIDFIDPQPMASRGRDRAGAGGDDACPLLARHKPLTVIELDRDLAARLRAHGGDVEVRRAEGGLPRTEPVPRARGCASSATCPTTSPRPSSSTCSMRWTWWWTSTSCCKRKWWTAWPPRRAAGLWAPLGDAAVALRHRVGARCAARVLRPTTPGGLGHRAHAAPGHAGGRQSGPAGRTRHQRLLAAPQAAAPHARPLAAGAALQGHFDLQRRAEEVPVSEYLALAEAVAAQRTASMLALAAATALGLTARRAVAAAACTGRGALHRLALPGLCSSC